MTSMTTNTSAVTGGVDTHGQTHHGAALDPVGRQLGDREFPTTPAGYRALLSWLQGYGHLERVGVEGTGSYGAGLTRQLRAAGVTVVEVDRPDRKARRAKGKSDPLDAYSAARAALTVHELLTLSKPRRPRDARPRPCPIQNRKVGGSTPPLATTETTGQ